MRTRYNIYISRTARSRHWRQLTGTAVVEVDSPEVPRRELAEEGSHRVAELHTLHHRGKPYLRRSCTGAKSASTKSQKLKKMDHFRVSVPMLSGTGQVLLARSKSGYAPGRVL